MNSKIQAYLKDTDPTGRYMRDVLSFYITGQMRSYLLKQHIINLEFFASIKKKEKSLNISFRYYNLYVILDFTEAGYEYCIYTKNCSAGDLENSIVQQSYSTDFSIEAFWDTFMRVLNCDARLVRTKPANEKKKRYKIISSICRVLTFLAIAIPSAYVLITRETIQGGPWFLVIILIPFILSQIFSFLSSKE